MPYHPVPLAAKVRVYLTSQEIPLEGKVCIVEPESGLVLEPAGFDPDNPICTVSARFIPWNSVRYIDILMEGDDDE